MITITRQDFEKFLQSDARTFEGRVILDSGAASDYYWRFVRFPFASGPHRVDVLYGCDYFVGKEDSALYEYGINFKYLCLLVDNINPYNETFDFVSLFDGHEPDKQHSIRNEMAQKLYDKLKESTPVTDDEYDDANYSFSVRYNAFARVIGKNANYCNPVDGIRRTLDTRFDINKQTINYLTYQDAWVEKFLSESSSFFLSDIILERLTKKYMKKYNDPTTDEYKFKVLLDAIGDAKTVIMTINIDGKTMDVKYETIYIKDVDVLYNKALPTSGFIAYQSTVDFRNFIKKPDEKAYYNYQLPFKYVEKITYKGKVIWTNPEMQKLSVAE